VQVGTIAALAPAVYGNCKVAILSALSMAYQRLPWLATVMPKGSLPVTALNSSVIPPSGAIPAMLPPSNE
jgi:hypothetical protein